MEKKGGRRGRTAGREWPRGRREAMLGSPQANGSMTVVPVLWPDGTEERVYRTLAEAVELGVAWVEEVQGGGRVPRVRVVNRGDLPILLIDGEELRGAKQNRVVSLTTLVPATSALEVSVVCVEQGRWSAGGGRFAVGTSFQNPASRSRKLADVCRSLASGGDGDADQGSVWAGVEEVLRDLRVQSRTSALGDAEAAHRERIETLASGFTVVPDQVGAVFMLGSRVVGVELVGDPRTWTRVFPRILRGYALDALRRREAAAAAGKRRRMASVALGRLAAGKWVAREVAGAGRALTLEAAGVTGTAVLLGARPVHLVAFFHGPSSGSNGGPGGRGGRGRRAGAGPDRGAGGGRLSVLVLDDDPQRHAEFARRGRGHRIDHVWFVDDALARLRRRRYDLVCLDNDLETEGLLREGREVAAFIATMPAEGRPRAVLVHSWNGPRALEMVETLRSLYEVGVSLLRLEFGTFRLAGPGPACQGEADLRRWIERRPSTDEGWGPVRAA